MGSRCRSGNSSSSLFKPRRASAASLSTAEKMSTSPSSGSLSRLAIRAPAQQDQIAALQLGDRMHPRRDRLAANRTYGAGSCTASSVSCTKVLHVVRQVGEAGASGGSRAGVRPVPSGTRDTRRHLRHLSPRTSRYLKWVLSLEFTRFFFRRRRDGDPFGYGRAKRFTEPPPKVALPGV